MMPYEPTPELNDVLIWEHCDPPTGVTIIGWDVSGGVDLPLRSFTALNEAYQTARAHAEYNHLSVWILGRSRPRIWKCYRP